MRKQRGRLSKLMRVGTAACLFAFTLSAHAQNIVYVAHGGLNQQAAHGGEIGTIDLDTGVYTPLVQYGSLTSLVWDGANFYTFEGVPGGDNGGNILKLDPTSLSVVDTIPVSIAFTDMAYDPTSGMFYGAGTDYNFYSVNVQTGATNLISDIGGFPGGFLQLAVAPDGTFYMHPTNGPGEFYTIDPSDGSVLTTIPGGVPGGALGLEVDPASGLLIASECCDSPDGSLGERLFSVDAATGNATLLYDYDDGRRMQDFAFANVTVDTARFAVTKTFSDGRDDEVDVHLTCNSGVPLEQDFTIAGGDPAGVTFVVQDIPDSGATCEVTESGGPAGYTPVLNGGNGCTWEGVTNGLYTCEISNLAQPATFTVNKEWVIENSVGEQVNQEINVTVYCNNEIFGGWWGSSYAYNAWLEGDDSLEVTVDTTTESAQCYAVESIYETGVESDDDCGSRTIAAGGSSSCTFTNTVFFEGIPTLSQWGLVMLAVLTLGVGLIGFRRFA